MIFSHKMKQLCWSIKFNTLRSGCKRSMYSEKEMDELVEKMVQFLKTHNVFELMELVTAAVATKEQE